LAQHRPALSIAGGSFVSVAMFLAEPALRFKTMRKNIMWKKPEFVDLRLGLEVTLYISNR
jgi:coenzyme PQQ precursor peptide PqqA